ncbi:MAG: Spy/CpxP family protein refolding chaperone [Polyangiaceae bacterium]
MHPGVFGFWRSRFHGHDSCGGEEGCGPHAAHFGWHGHHGPHHGPAGPHQGPFGGGGGGGGDDFGGGGGFGVRRPLRFLAYKLELEDDQVAELAAILSELKTERAQAAVDYRRTTTSLADAVGAESFDEGKAKAATEERVKSDERVQTAVAKALGRIHALLQAPQRSKLAYLLRTGALSI